MDEISRVEIRSDAYPGERLMVCRHPLRARPRTRQRPERLSKTEERLDEIVAPPGGIAVLIGGGSALRCASARS